jgi:hypothetical protein
MTSKRSERHSVDEKFELLYTILKDLQDAGVLKHVVLVGSWCQEFYRHHFDNSFEIPATRTMDADILIPRRLKLSHPVDVHEIFRKRGFVTQMHYDSGFAKFIHRELTFEFLTDAGAKAEEKQHPIKDLNIVAQELHFMNIPLAHHMTVQYREVTLTIPEPEAFALHKLIVSQRRRKPEKRDKDIATARGMFQFFKGKDQHVKRLHQLINDMPKGWQKKISAALNATGIILPQ